MNKEYKTILRQAAAEIEEKRSRFIASARPVSTEEEAIVFINELKTKYWDATHNVYAYYICGDNVVQRCTDDGEPSGTAGLPVLEAIKKRNLQNLAVVVTRYFGGTLLGAAGLIRAYGKSATACIEAAGVITKQLCTEVSVIVEYTLFGKLQSEISANGYKVKTVIYEQDVEIITYIPFDEVQKFIALISEATNGRLVIEESDKSYITLGEDGRLIL